MLIWLIYEWMLFQSDRSVLSEHGDLTENWLTCLSVSIVMVEEAVERNPNVSESKLNFIGADSAAPKVFQSKGEIIDYCIQGAVVPVAFAWAHDVPILCGFVRGPHNTPNCREGITNDSLNFSPTAQMASPNDNYKPIMGASRTTIFFVPIQWCF